MICPNLQVPNGIVTYSGPSFPRAEGSIATYSCVTGYDFSGGVVLRTCITTGWTDGGSPTCTGLCGKECVLAQFMLWTHTTAICPELTLSNGHISYDPDSPTILQGVVVKHSCVTGYQLSSSNTTRTCQSDRMWSGDDITCECMRFSCSTYRQ